MQPTVAEPTPPRVPLDVDVECRAQGQAPATFQSMNLSEGGIFLKSPFPLDISTPVTCTFRLPDGQPAITVQGEVAWTRSGPPEQIPPPGMGVRFSGMPQEAAQRVRQHVQLMEENLLDTAEPHHPTSQPEAEQSEEAPKKEDLSAFEDQLFETAAGPENEVPQPAPRSEEAPPPPVRFEPAREEASDSVLLGVPAPQDSVGVATGMMENETTAREKPPLFDPPAPAPPAAPDALPPHGTNAVLSLDIEANPKSQSARLLMEGDVVTLAGEEGSSHKGEVSTLTADGLGVDIPLEGLERNALLWLSRDTQRESQARIVGARLDTRGPLKLHLELDLLDPTGEGLKTPPASPPRIPTFQELEPPTELPVAPQKTSPSEDHGAQEDGPFSQPPIPPSLVDEWGADLDEEISQHPNSAWASSTCSHEGEGAEEGPDPMAIEHVSRRGPRQGPKHSGIVDFKSRISKNPRRRARTQTKPGLSRRGVVFLGGAALGIVALFFAVYSAFGGETKSKPPKKNNAPHAKREKPGNAEHKKPRGVSLDPQAVKLPRPSGTNTGSPPPLPGEAGETAADPSEPSPRQEGPRWAQKPKLKRRGGRVQLQLPTKGRPTKVTSYPLAKPPGWVVDLHGVTPRLKPGRYPLKGRNARLLKVTKRNGGTRFIVYFNTSVPRKVLEVKGLGGGGSVTWPAKKSPRRLSARKRRSGGRSRRSSNKKLTLAD